MAMKRPFRQLAQFTSLMATFAVTAALAQAQTSDTGTVSQSGIVSGYVEVRAGGAATLANSTGGSINRNKIKGESLYTPPTIFIKLSENGPARGPRLPTF